MKTHFQERKIKGLYSQKPTATVSTLTQRPKVVEKINLGLLKFLSKKIQDALETIGITIVTMVTNSVSTRLHTDYSYTHYTNITFSY